MNQSNGDGKETKPIYVGKFVYTESSEKKEPAWKDPSIRWHVETKTTDSMWEAYVWVDDEVLSDIGWQYDGYRTADPKIAYTLMFELIKANTNGWRNLQVFSGEDFVNGKIDYLVWLSQAR